MIMAKHLFPAIVHWKCPTITSHRMASLLSQLGRPVCNPENYLLTDTNLIFLASSFSHPFVRTTVFPCGPPVGYHSVQRPTYYPGPSTPAGHFGNWSLPTDTNPMQMPTPSDSYPMSTVAMNMLSPDFQGHTGLVFQQSTAANQVPLFPQPSSR